MLLPALVFATERWAGPSGSGSTCSFASPCSLDTAKSASFAGDTVWLKDGTYNQSFKTVRAGTSNTARITFKAVNRHAAIVRFQSGGPHSHFHIDHSWITVSGLNIWATSSGGSHAHDASKISNGNDQHGAIQGIIFEDNYIHEAGHLMIWTGNTNGAGVIIRHNTFDLSGLDHFFGEANYLGSCCGKQNPGVVDAHHNIFSRYGAEGINYKGEYRSGYYHDNFFMDHKQYQCTCGNSNCTTASGGCANNYTGDGFSVIDTDSGDGSSSSTSNRIVDSVIWRSRAAIVFNFNDPVQVRAFGNVIVDWVPTSGTSGPNMNATSGSYYAPSITYSNIHCPSEGMGHNQQNTGGNPANQINQPIATCNTRIDEIVGKPDLASCEIGAVNDNTVVVNITTAKNGPVSGIPIPLEVTYNGTNQTGETTTLFSGNQARIAVVTPPANDAVVVRVVSSAGAIRNSAFIGAKDCDNGANFGDANYIRTGGFCGENNAETLICTNTTEGTGPPPVTEALNQAVWRFYAMHNAEGVSPLAPENTSFTSGKGGEFRWRVGVRGGGNDAPSRSYALAARVCKPTCGGWFKVSDDPNVGVVFWDDLIQDDGTATTNKLALGGKTFLSGIFIDEPRSTPAKAILTTQQIEWEFGLQIPIVTSAVAEGDTIELRMQHDDGTALSAYTLPSITVGPPGVGGEIGSRAGQIGGTMK